MADVLPNEALSRILSYPAYYPAPPTTTRRLRQTQVSSCHLPYVPFQGFQAMHVFYFLCIIMRVSVAPGSWVLAAGSWLLPPTPSCLFSLLFMLYLYLYALPGCKNGSPLATL